MLKDSRDRLLLHLQKLAFSLDQEMMDQEMMDQGMMDQGMMDQEIMDQEIMDQDMVGTEPLVSTRC